MPTQTEPKTEEIHSHPATHANHVGLHEDCAECQAGVGVSGPDFAAKLATLAAERDKVIALPDGSVLILVPIVAEDKEIIASWAEGAQEDFVTYARRTMQMGMDAILRGGAVAG